jgi:hypothetical protein
VRVGAVEVVSKADFVVGTGRIVAPDLLAGLDVVCGDVAANTELSTRRADDREIVNNVRSLRQRLTDLDVAVLDLPELFARLGIEGNEVAVELRLDNQRRRLVIARPVSLRSSANVLFGNEL